MLPTLAPRTGSSNQRIPKDVSSYICVTWRARTTKGAGRCSLCAVMYSPTARASTELHTKTRILMSIVHPCRLIEVFCSLDTLVITCEGLGLKV
jgi:hypothetical protein